MIAAAVGGLGCAMTGFRLVLFWALYINSMPYGRPLPQRDNPRQPRAARSPKGKGAPGFNAPYPAALQGHPKTGGSSFGRKGVGPSAGHPGKYQNGA